MIPALEGGAPPDDVWPRTIHVANAAVRRFHFAPGDPRSAVLTLAPNDGVGADRLALWRESSAAPLNVRAPNGNIRDAVALAGGNVLVAVGGNVVEIDARSGAASTRGRFGGEEAFELATDQAASVIALTVTGESRPLVLVDPTGVRSFGPPPDRSFSPMFPNAAVSADGCWAALSCGFDDMYLVDVRSGSVERVPSPSTVPPHESIADPATLQAALNLVGKYTRRIWLSQSGDLLIAAGMIPFRSYAPAMCLRIVVRSGTEFRDSYVAMDSTFSAVDLTPDLALCVASEGQSRDTVAVRDVATGQALAQIRHEGENLLEARFSHDGSRVALAGGGKAFVHRVETRRWRAPGSDNGVWDLTIDGRSTMVAVGGDEFADRFADQSHGLRLDWAAAIALAEKLSAS
jgi:hypothetical protein